MDEHRTVGRVPLRASWKPFGLGEQRPNNYFEVFRAAWENRGRLRYAWRILSRGVCDGCALGTTGLKDWTLEGPHLCNIRLRLLRLNTMPPLSASLLDDAAALSGKSSGGLRKLGRLPYPALRRRGEPGFQRISWDDALDRMAKRVAASSPDRLGFYLTSRGIPNETYYLAQKAVRALGTNSIDNAARLCHAPSTGALKQGLGVGATTCSYSDWIQSDLIVFVGSNVANNQPVATKYLHHARKSGTRVAMVNNYREPGMERYWIPSVPESALFGTRLTDRFFLVDVGGDLAFLTGTLKVLIERGWIERDFVEKHTTGFAELESIVAAVAWEELERGSGSTRDEMAGLAQMLHEARSAVLVWSMGVTQHECGVDNVAAIINLALSQGFVGKPGSGLMPIRGHSGVQGGAEMGAYATAFPGGVPIDAEAAASLGKQWGFPVPTDPGMMAPEMIEAAGRGELDFLFAAGGSFSEVLPDPQHVTQCLERIPLRVHMDLVLSPVMLLDPAEEVLLLPAATRYEIPGGVTETSTERRIIFSPEIPGARPGESRPEGEVLLELARRVRPERASRLQLNDMTAVRQEISQIVPFYRGIERLKKAGDQVQYGGAHLCEDWDFPTHDGKAHFASIRPSFGPRADGEFLLTTRRGKQFNSMVHENRDALTGAERDAVFMSGDDATRLDLTQGDHVVLTSSHGQMVGRIWIAPVKPGNLQVHWPEGNVLLDRGKRSKAAGIPDYNARVRLARANAT